MVVFDVLVDTEEVVGCVEEAVLVGTDGVVVVAVVITGRVKVMSMVVVIQASVDTATDVPDGSVDVMVAVVSVVSGYVVVVNPVEVTSVASEVVEGG